MPYPLNGWNGDNVEVFFGPNGKKSDTKECYQIRLYPEEGNWNFTTAKNKADVPNTEVIPVSDEEFEYTVVYNSSGYTIEAFFGIVMVYQGLPDSAWGINGNTIVFDVNVGEGDLLKVDGDNDDCTGRTTILSALGFSFEGWHFTSGLGNLMFGDKIVPSGVKNNLANINIGIYPNPVVSQLTVDNLMAYGATHVKVVNMLGQEVINQQVTSDMVNLTLTNKGIFMVEVFKGNELIKATKIVK
ncbi:MAG: T9SS type A sorting domain-containing protein [Bacteroidales bacterium]|nr:T9SS type A sorting domain-containing protein [Bacteroidales bacterium]